MGWQRLERVWLPSWIRSRSAVVADIVDAAEQARTPVAAEPPVVDQDLAEDRTEPGPAAEANPEPDRDLVPVGARAGSGTGSSSGDVAGSPTGDSADRVRNRPASPDVPPTAGGTEAPVEGRDDVYVPAPDRDAGPKAVLDAITEPGNRKLVREHLEEIIAAEGPVEAQRLARLLGNRFELKRIQGQRQTAILGCLPRGRSSRSALGTFYWPADRSPEEYTGFRRTLPGGEKRAVGEIAPEEVGNAVVHALRSEGPCPVDDVFQTLNGVFGFNRTGREIRERWSEVVELLESSGRIVRRGGLLELP